ncbi:MAG: MerR family transcriptional regulator [Anaerolineae bacterium]|nr:MerR family transcriptional regulator [Anaerolineae bacterium]
MTTNMTPTYNLKVVVQETSIKPDTLRAWERRYGLPEPKRTEGKHRLYSDYDIAIIKWLMSRQEEGLSISRAVKLWHSLEKSGQNPLATRIPSPTTLKSPQNHSTTVPIPVNPINGSTVTELRAFWVDACLQFNEAQAEGVLTKAFALYPAEMVVLELLQKGLVRIGELWYENKATVQQEHFASALAMRRLNTLVTAAPPPNRPGKIMVACPADEHHVFAPLFLTLSLRYQGWETIYLGANVPRDYLESTIATAKPDVIVMTAQQLHTAASLFVVAQFLQQEGMMLAYGGRIFNQAPLLRRRIPGHFLGEQLETAVSQIDYLLAERPFTPPVDSVPESHSRALHQFRTRQAAIETELWQALEASDIPYEELTNANLHLAKDISAALTLGNISLLSEEISWTEKLLLNYDMPADHLARYLSAYNRAAHHILGQECAPILQWLDNIANEKAEKQ